VTVTANSNSNVGESGAKRKLKVWTKEQKDSGEASLETLLLWQIVPKFQCAFGGELFARKVSLQNAKPDSEPTQRP